jgi:endoglucanase
MPVTSLLRRVSRGRPLVLAGAAALVAGCSSAPAPAPGRPAFAASESVVAEPAGRRALGTNPFVGAKWWSDPMGTPRLQALRMKKTDPDGAALLEKIADRGGADWIGEWTPNVERWVRDRVAKVTKAGGLPLLVAYRIPKRDCGMYSAGGFVKGTDYRDWIAALGRGIGDAKAVVILEPDAVPLLKKCLSDADQKERLELLAFAVRTLTSLPRTWVYLDAGHSDWIPAAEMAERLKGAGIGGADGFSLNVSNYKTTEALMAYGKDLSARLGGKPFVIDTSRNGNGPPDAPGDSEASWCNPAGRALGSPPTAETADPLCHAYLWIKKPGESDGDCNGGPRAGMFWTEQAIGLAKRAKW